ncbi:MAG: response regulator transcription factor [Spirulinaceae cyanobacterium]
MLNWPMSPVNLDSNSCVLLIETDETLTQKANLDLREAGYKTSIALDADSGMLRFEQLQPSVIVVDRALGEESGLFFCRQLRLTGSRVPILILMSRDSVEDRVACLEAGADDYLLKPYRTDAFLQLISFYLQPNQEETKQLRFGELVLDLSTRRVLRQGRNIELTVKEFELLKYLMSHPREVLTREQILENVWGYDFVGESNVIEVYIRYLRLKIEDEGEKRLIQTVRGVGYVLRET